MNIRRVAALVFIPAILMLSACDGDSPTETATPQSDSRSYRGATVVCYDLGSGKTRMGTCDFDAFYEQNPSLLNDESMAAEDGVTWMDVDGKPLACVQVGSGSTRFMGCDWVRYGRMFREAR